MGNDNTLLVLALIAAVVSVIGFFMVYSVNTVLLQPAVDTGEARVEIIESANIQFSHNIVNWGAGFVSTGLLAVLDTEGATTEFNGPSVLTVSDGFIIENTGNVNLVLDIGSSNDVDTFLDGSTPATNLYQYKVETCHDGITPKCEAIPSPGRQGAADDGVINTCNDQTPFVVLSPDPWVAYRDMPLVGTPDVFCGELATGNGMLFNAANDEIEINILLTFDDQINPNVGVPKTSTITVTGTAAT